ncbi:MAG: site-specific integrase [Pseudomonadota bacterium]
MALKNRSKARGTVTLVGHRQYRARIMVRGERLSRTFETQELAVEWLRTCNENLRNSRLSAARLAEQVTFRRALEMYLVEITPHKKDWKGETGVIQRMFVGPLGGVLNKPLSEVLTSDLAAYVRERLGQTNQRAGRRPLKRRNAKVTGSTVNRELAVISHLFNTARSKWGYDGLQNPVTRGVRCKENRSRDRRLEGDEEARLMRAAAAHDAAARATVPLVAVIRFAIASTMRIGEIASLKWSQVDFKRSRVIVSITQSKNGRARGVALPPSAMRLLESLPRNDGELVFGNLGAIGNAFKIARDRAGIPDLRFHDLRHEAVSRLFEETDLTDAEIAAISGHLTAQMLRRYAHLRTDHIAAKLARAETTRNQLHAASSR